jgi:ferredoxin-like protein FixX
MPQWFVRGLRRGVVATRYPARPEPSARYLETPPTFRTAELTPAVADTLVQVCPSRALRRSADSLIFDVGACTACGRCREAVPAAVSTSGEFELAATRREALIKTIPLGTGR